jgi:membrane protein DedA with SNARE-associated domain
MPSASLGSVSHALIQLVSSGGLIAIFLLMTAESAGIPISSEIVVPLGGALASGALAGEAHLNFFGVVAASSVGNLLGSLIAYLLVRAYGKRFILGPGRRIGLNAGHLALAQRFFDRWGLLAVFGGRLLPVIRTYISFPAGLSRIRTAPFAAATIVGAIPWNFALAYAGLKLGENWTKVESLLGKFTIPAAIVVLVLLGLAYYFGKRMGTEDRLMAKIARVDD